jgi:hypothetical protein
MNSFLIVGFLLFSGASYTNGGSRTYGSSCGTCGVGNSASYNNGKNLGGAVAGVIGNTVQDRSSLLGEHSLGPFCLGNKV